MSAHWYINTQKSGSKGVNKLNTLKNYQIPKENDNTRANIQQLKKTFCCPDVTVMWNIACTYRLDINNGVSVIHIISLTLYLHGKEITDNIISTPFGPVVSHLGANHIKK